MKELFREVTACVDNEYGRAAIVHGATHHSAHEAYAVILEEFEEAMTEVHIFKFELGNFWNNIKGNIDNPKIIAEMQERAEHAAAEWIQVAAMCKKTLMKKDGAI